MSEKNPILMSLKTTNYSRIPLIAKWYLGGPLTNSRMTKWSMDDMSLSPMHNVGIYRTHWAIQKKYYPGEITKRIERAK